MLRPYEGGRLGDSNGRIYAIAAHVGQAPDSLPIWLCMTHKAKDGLNRPCRRKQKPEESQTPPYTRAVNPP